MQIFENSGSSGSLSYSKDARFYVTNTKLQNLDQKLDQKLDQEMLSPDAFFEILSQKKDIVWRFYHLFFYKFLEFPRKEQIQKHPKFKIIQETLPRILLEIPSLEKIQLVSSKFKLRSDSRSTLGPSCFLVYNTSEVSLDDCLGGIIRLLILSLSNPEMMQPGPHMLSCRLSLLIELQELAIENRKQDDLLPPVSIEEFDAALNMLEGLLEKITDSGKQEARVKLDKLKSISWKDQFEVFAQPPLESRFVDQEDDSLGVSSGSGKELTDCINKPAF